MCVRDIGADFLVQLVVRMHPENYEPTSSGAQLTFGGFSGGDG